MKDWWGPPQKFLKKSFVGKGERHAKDEDFGKTLPKRIKGYGFRRTPATITKKENQFYWFFFLFKFGVGFKLCGDFCFHIKKRIMNNSLLNCRLSIVMGWWNMVVFTCASCTIFVQNVQSEFFAFCVKFLRVCFWFFLNWICFCLKNQKKQSIERVVLSINVDYFLLILFIIWS